jgi:hypothetical protein
MELVMGIAEPWVMPGRAEKHKLEAITYCCLNWDFPGFNCFGAIRGPLVVLEVDKFMVGFYPI